MSEGTLLVDSGATLAIELGVHYLNHILSTTKLCYHARTPSLGTKLRDIISS